MCAGAGGAVGAQARREAPHHTRIGVAGWQPVRRVAEISEQRCGGSEAGRQAGGARRLRRGRGGRLRRGRQRPDLDRCWRYRRAAARLLGVAGQRGQAEHGGAQKGDAQSARPCHHPRAWQRRCVGIRPGGRASRRVSGSAPVLPRHHQARARSAALSPFDDAVSAALGAKVAYESGVSHNVTDATGKPMPWTLA